MIFAITPSDYALTGLDDCCSYYPVTADAYCGVNLIGDLCTKAGGTIVTDANGNDATGVYACNVGAGASQLVCAGVYPGSTYIPVNSTNQYVSSGECVLSITPPSGCGCTNSSLVITQSIDMCNLAANTWNQLSASSLNFFKQTCN